MQTASLRETRLGVAALVFGLLQVLDPRGSFARELAFTNPKGSQDDISHSDLYGDLLPPNAVARMGTARFGHIGGINGVAFSPNGRYLASVGESQLLHIWRVPSGKLHRKVLTKQDSLTCVAFSPDGQTIATGGTDGTVSLWQTNSGKHLRRKHFGSTQGITAIAFSPNGSHLAIGLSAGPIVIWDARGNCDPWNLPGHRDGTLSISFSAAGKLLASAGADNAIRIWSGDTFTDTKAIVGPEDHCFVFVAISPDGKTLATADPLRLQIWDVASGKVIRCVHTNSEFEGNAVPLPVVFSSTGTRVAVAGLGVWTAVTGKGICHLEGRAVGGPAVAFSPNGKFLATGGASGSLCLYDSTTGKEIYPWAGHRHAITSIAYSRSGKIIASVAMEDKTMYIWDAATGKEIRHFPCRQYWASGVAFSGDDSVVASQDVDGNVRLWDATTGQEDARTRGYEEGVPAVAFSSDGRILTLQKSDSSYNLCDPDTRKYIPKFAGEQTWLAQGLAISPDGTLLAIGSRQTEQPITLWDIASGKLLRSLRGNSVGPAMAAFSPDGNTLAIAGADRTVELWNPKTGKFLLRLTGRRRFPCSIAFSPDGKTLATGDEDGTIRLFELLSGRERWRFHGNGGSCIVFSPDGKTMATDSDGKNILVWDLTLSSTEEMRGGAATASGNMEPTFTVLGGEDATKAYLALQIMVRRPADTLTFLKSRLRPVKAPDSRRIDDMVSRLDSNDFKLRAAAEEQLAAWGELAEPNLRSALFRHSSPELRLRATRLLEKFDKPVTDPEILRTIRVVEVLDHIGTPEARDLLKTLAGGAPPARLTREAKQALARLDRLSSRK